MVNVLFIAYHFPPIGGAPAQRTLKHIKYLQDDGYLPVVVTGPGESHDEWTPHDRTLSEEISKDISVHRVKTRVPQARGKLLSRTERLLGIQSPFAKWWVGSAIDVASTVCAKENIKLIYASMSPFESANASEYLSKKFSIPWVADLRDGWAIDELNVYQSFIHRKYALARMHRLLSSASVIIMNTPEATTRLKRTFPDFCQKRVVTITNGFDPENLKEATMPLDEKKFRIVHTGTFFTDAGLIHRRNRRFNEALGGSQRGVDIATRSPLFLLGAIKKWGERDPKVYKQLELVFVGNASDTERSIADSSLISNLIHFTGYLPRKESLEIIKTAGLLFLPMHNLSPGKRSASVPSKIYEYMASGRPILAAVPDGDARDFFAQCGTAFICRPDDTDSMISILDKVYKAWERKDQITQLNKEFLHRFERKTLTKCLAKEFDRVLKHE